MSVSQFSKSDLVWISRRDNLPDTCCSCGMFTDNRVKVKYVEVQKVMRAGDSRRVTLIRILSLFLGPIGWLVSAMVTSNDEEKLTTIKKKSRIVVSQCLLCSGMERAVVVDSKESPQRFALLTHPEFRKRFDAINSLKKE